MMLRRYVFAAAVAALLARPVRIADAQSTARTQNDIVQLDPVHTGIDFTLLGNLHNTRADLHSKAGSSASILKRATPPVKSK